MVFKYDQNASNYAFSVKKIYLETKKGENYKYTFKINKILSNYCISSKIYKGDILLKANNTNTYIYSHKFALYPENSKPTGSCNLSRIYDMYVTKSYYI